MEEIMFDGGWIYIFLSSSDYTRSKIGKSIDPLRRFREQRTSDPTLGLVVAYYIPLNVGPHGHVESSLHHYFSDYRILNHDGTKSEWFRITPEEAQLQIECLLEEWCRQEIKSAGHMSPRILTRFFESDLVGMFKPDPYELRYTQEVCGLK